MMKADNWVRILCKLFIWTMLGLVIYWILLKLTGHSPTADQIIIAMGSVAIVMIYAIGKDVSKIETDMKWVKRDMRRMSYHLNRKIDDLRDELKSKKLI